MKKLSGGKSLAVMAVAGGAILASVAPVMAEVSAQSPSLSAVRVESPAKLKAWGAAAELKVTYACPAGSTSTYLYLNLTQNAFGRIASGGTSKNVQCTGGFETITLTLTSQNAPFLPGIKAYAKAELNSYPNSATDEREIDVWY
ncbi:hypothetical protein UK23_28700 [Lentzea aerocolonigenes]|uniref:Spore coat protein U domain-containing protein n=1 Tax=Lentzea aerocolonigenes TaxID=68170 RepID=A0A0F0GTD0_LENAE|nr:hypothetical protein [Lentzea aerocolonigenes]KJK44658.1 hypothetical protein UK23_28700 [Lentzea aerocolonigenes]